jgi:hypothetical protein
MQHCVGWPFPTGFAALGLDGQLHAMLQEPPEGLTNRPELDEFSEHQRDGFLHATIRILLDMSHIGLKIRHCCGHPELAALGLRASRASTDCCREIQAL